jgi:hypothetical protein
MGIEAKSYAFAIQVVMDFQIPSQASLHVFFHNKSSIRAANQPRDFWSSYLTRSFPLI